MVKRKNDTFNYTLCDQWRHAARGDCTNFLAKRYKIVNAHGYTQDLVLNGSQQRIIRAIEHERKEGRCPRLNILKSRQRGISTGTGGFCFHDCYTGENASAVIMTHLESVTEDLRQKMIFAYDNLPELAKMPWKNCNPDVLSWFHNNAVARFGSAENPHFAIGRTVRQFWGSEHTRWPDFNTIYKDNLQGVPDSVNAWIILESTAHGTDHPSYDFWEACEKGLENFIPIFLKWWEDEDAIAAPFASQREQDETLDRIFFEFPQAKDRMQYFFLDQGMDPGEAALRIHWYYQRWISCRRDMLKLQENFPMTAKEAFIASGNPFFPMEVVDKLRVKCKEGELFDPTMRFSSRQTMVKSPGITREKDTYLEIFRWPEAGKTYLLSADAGTGSNVGCYSAACVFEKTTGDLCAILRGRMETTPFAEAIIDLSHIYFDCRVAPEAKGNGGHALMEILKYKKFNRFWYRRKPTNKGWITTADLGWDTNTTTRPIMLEQARRFMREKVNQEVHNWFIPSAHLLDEMRTFVDREGKPMHKKGSYDDMVMAWAIGIMICLIDSSNGLVETGLHDLSRGNGSDEEQKIITPSQTLKMIMSENWCGQSFGEFYKGK